MAYDQRRRRSGVVVHLPDGNAPFYLLRPTGGGDDWAVRRRADLSKTDRFRFREYTITPDAEPDAEPHSYAMECAVCSEVGPFSGKAAEAHAWVPAHLRVHPEHLTYREHVTRPYRAIPGAWL